MRLGGSITLGLSQLSSGLPAYTCGPVFVLQTLASQSMVHRLGASASQSVVHRSLTTNAEPVAPPPTQLTLVSSQVNPMHMKV